MNLLKRIGNIFMKMAPRRKPVDVPEKLVQQERTKVAPIRDIEDLIKSETTKSPYFSPIKTRNQRVNNAAAEAKTNKLKSTLASQAPVLVKNDTEEYPTNQSAKESKKTKEMKAMIENLKKLPDLEGPLEVSMPEPATIVEPIAARAKKVTKPKRVAKESQKVVKTKQLLEESTAEATSSTEAVKKEEEALPSPVKVAKRKSKDSSKSPEIKQDKWEPNNWIDILENIRVMRASVPAPVDTMGCHKCSDENADEKTRRFHVLLALMLSSQTKDEVTHEAMKRLTAKSCTPRVIAEMEPEKLETLLHPVSFYKNKAKYLKNTSQILIDRYDSDIPNDIKGLIKLPGVGPKMAHICMNSAWNIVTGIGVDVHVHRIANRLGWVRQETKQPEKTRKELESWLPSDYWKEVNHLLVGFGQTICTPIKPKCAECLNKAICPAAFVVKSKKVKTKKVVL